MPVAHIVKEVKINRSVRVKQIEGMFDIPPGEKLKCEWDVNLPLDEKDWNVGLIVGPSGCGKSVIKEELFSDNVYENLHWDDNKSVLDAFPKSVGIKDITSMLNSVGFSSPPSWLKPFQVLSNGEQFRVTIARALIESKELCVVDEFTSVVDRVVARCGSAAVAKTVRRYGKKFIAISCHYDIEEWLQPDWVYLPMENDFQWRLVQRRPEIKLEVARVHHKAWSLFRQYHYLNANLNKAARCFVAFWNGVPVAFIAYLHLVNNRIKNAKKGHRVVVLPDYQGVGVGMALIRYIAACLKAVGFGFYGRTALYQVMSYRNRSSDWAMIKKPEVALNHGGRGTKGLDGVYPCRMVQSHKFIGDPVDEKEARKLLCIT